MKPVDRTTKEQELDWYFETWLNMPMIGAARAARAVDALTAFGTNLHASALLWCGKP